MATDAIYPEFQHSENKCKIMNPSFFPLLTRYVTMLKKFNSLTQIQQKINAQYLESEQIDVD
jgi:hypothetical protein